MMCGGLSSSDEVSEEVKQICEELRSEFDKKVQGSVEMYIPVKYSTQVVAGTNYFVKIQTGAEKYVHVKIFRPLPCNREENDPEFILEAIQEGKTLEEGLEYFA